MTLYNMILLLKNYKSIAFIFACVMKGIADDIGIVEPQMTDILMLKASDNKRFVYRFAKKITTPKKSIEDPGDIAAFIIHRTAMSSRFVIKVYEENRAFYIEMSKLKGGELV